MSLFWLFEHCDGDVIFEMTKKTVKIVDLIYPYPTPFTTCLACFVFEISGGRAVIPPSVRSWLRPRSVRGLKLESQYRKSFIANRTALLTVHSCLCGIVKSNEMSSFTFQKPAIVVLHWTRGSSTNTCKLRCYINNLANWPVGWMDQLPLL